jgi:hypothetical protein
VDTRATKKTSKKNVDGRCTSSHENKTFRSRLVVKQKGMVFGFRKTATAVRRPERWIEDKNGVTFIMSPTTIALEGCPSGRRLHMSCSVKR